MTSSELDIFHAASKKTSAPAHATYLISGERPRPSPLQSTTQESDEMDVDTTQEDNPTKEEEEEQESVPQNDQVLVSEADLEGQPKPSRRQPSQRLDY